MAKKNNTNTGFNTAASQWANWQVMVQPVLREAKAKKVAAKAKFEAAIAKAKAAYEAELAKIDATRTSAFEAFDNFKAERDGIKAAKKAAKAETETGEEAKVEAPVIEA